jgi:ABC-type uncharacterized transport system fused permease/ATPase subunit
MEKVFGRIEDLASSIKEYADLRIENTKLQLAEKTSGVMANFIAGIVVMVVFLHFVIFGSIALSFGIGDFIGKTWAGFLIVAVLYLVIGIIVWFARVKIIRLPIMNSLITQLFSKDEAD